MSGDGSGSIERAIGNLEGRVGSLIKAVTENDEKSSATRARMFKKIDEISNDVHDMRGRVEALEKSYDGIKPNVDEFVTWRSRVEGAGMLGKFLWALGGLILGGAAWLVAALSSGWPHGK